METSREVTVLPSFMQVEQNQPLRVGGEDREGPTPLSSVP